MKKSIHNAAMSLSLKKMFGLMIFFLPAFVPHASSAGGDDDAGRVEFYGIVQSRPTGVLFGRWIIGGNTFMVDAGTEFDQSEGELRVGGCAKVSIRNDRVHEIDSEPMRDCR